MGVQRKQNNVKFDHKTKKLHPAYDTGANILRLMSLKQAPFTTLFSKYMKLSYCKLLYALVIRVLKNQDVIEKIFNELPIESDMNDFLIRIFIGEILFGQNSYKAYRHTKEIKFIIEHETEIKSLYSKLKSKYSKWENNVRYIRVNYLKNDDGQLKKSFIELGFKLKNYQKTKTSFDEFKNLAKSLKPKELMYDYHFKDVLLINDGDISLIQNSNLAKFCSIAIQDKASLLALEAMNLQDGVVVFDACAAPGMKSAAIASRLKNNCTLICNDRDTSRFKEMKGMLAKCGVTSKEMLNYDFTEMDPEPYLNADVLLLDPSCSGSGIYRRFDFNAADKNQDDSNAKRIDKLSKFQVVMLESALRFNPKRIVYCTCSVHQEENEDVINKLIENNPDLNYEVVDPMQQWPFRGIGDYAFSKLCLRANFEQTLTNGFFCCLLLRKDLVDEYFKHMNKDCNFIEQKPEAKLNKPKCKIFIQNENVDNSSVVVSHANKNIQKRKQPENFQHDNNIVNRKSNEENQNNNSTEEYLTKNKKLKISKRKFNMSRLHNRISHKLWIQLCTQK